MEPGKAVGATWKLHSLSRSLDVLITKRVHTNQFCITTYFLIAVPTGSPSRDGDVTVYAFDINQPSLPTPFYSVLVSISVFMALSTVFCSINSLDNSPLSHSVFSGLISVLLVLSTVCLFIKVSFSPDIILCG